ncbi:MAG: hypothetical protein JOZ38_12635 [Candidatus Eremiobacteraeota bacterium]|nr:hypothetical protein [Candidatus Eremiobacteraeota bacterium]
MKSAARALALGVLLVWCSSVARGASDGSAVLASAYGRNAALASYTFRMQVAMTMHHFPWLRFHMQGTGRYQRGVRYDVQFADVPFFAGNFHRVDLSTLAPAMWKNHYRVSVVGPSHGNTVFRLVPNGPDTLQEAFVTVGPTSGANLVQMHYTDGSNIVLRINSTDVTGYLVPVQAQATIDAGHNSLSADATFSDYSFAVKRASSPARLER